jgi:hypothetical protein
MSFGRLVKKPTMGCEGGHCATRSKMGASSWRQLAARICTFATVLLPVLSCEQAFTIKGTITVPLVVQQKFSQSQRGRLVMAATLPDGSQVGGRTISMLCDPGSVDLVVPFSLTKFGCAAEMSAEGMVIPLSADPHAEVFKELPCGLVSEAVGAASSALAIAYGHQVVFAGRHGGSCNATAVADITVALTQ